MNRFDAPYSIFAPVFAAVPSAAQWAGFGVSAIAASQAVPVETPTYRVRRGGQLRPVREFRERKLAYIGGQNAKPFSAKVCLYDRASGEGRDTLSVAETQWQVGISVYSKDGLCAPAVPPGYQTAILQTSIFKLEAGKVSGAPQLALFRHLWAEAVLAASPDAIVFGGQHHWQDDWWTEEMA